MNAIKLAQNAYQNQAQPTRTARDTEYNAFARITHQMKEASARGKAGFNDLVKALQANRRLWTILSVDVMDSSNALPKELRARIVYLSEFTRQHTSQVLSGNASVDALIEINTAIMRGLRAKSETQ